MLSTVVQAFFGFAFWFLNARLFSPADIGLASALISASTFIAYLSLLGFNSTFVRFLPTSKQRNDKINTGLILVLCTGVIVSLVYLALLPVLAPSLTFVTTHVWYVLGFVLLSAAAAGNLLTDSIFIAYRSAQYNLRIYAIQSVAKLLLPLAFIGLGAYGVFAASGTAMALALGLSVSYLIRRFHYRPAVVVSREVIKSTWSFSSASYAANLLNIVPTLVLPLIVVNQLGPESAGYFYLAFMLVNLLYAVAYAVAQSLFAEGSYGQEGFRHLLTRATALLMAVMVPAALVMAVAGPWVLQLFGKSYGDGAAATIVVLALSAPAVAAYVLACVVLRITKQTVALVLMNVFYAFIICALAWMWSGKGLAWVAGAWLVGNVATAFVGAGAVWYGRNMRRTKNIAAA